MKELTKEKKFILLAFLIFLITSFFSEGFYHGDEHYQLLEFAGLKLGLTTETSLPWEYTFQMRPTFQPYLVVGLYNLIDVFTDPNPFIVSFLLRLISTCFAFGSILLFYHHHKDQFERIQLKKIYFFLTFFTFFIVYNGVRYSSENWSAFCFIYAFILLTSKKHKNTLLYFFYSGLLLGLAFIFRFQSMFLIGGLGLWLIFIQKASIKKIVVLFSGFSVFFVVGVLSDRLFYGKWVLSIWNYFDQNLIQDKVSGFGVSPWWSYFTEFFIQGTPFISILFSVSLILFLFYQRKSALTWTLVPFILVHFLIGHKEIRFFFPIINFLPFITVKVIQTLNNQQKIRFNSQHFMFRLYFKLLTYTNILVLAVIMFKPTSHQIALYKSIYSQYVQPRTLYYTTDNPYGETLKTNFYKRTNLTVKKTSDLDSLFMNNHSNYCVLIKNEKKDLLTNKNIKMVYSSFPKWVYHFNFNNWIERSSPFYIYEINGRDPLKN